MLKITEENKNNEYLKAYFDINNITETRTIDYMFWIDRKHTEYRKIIKLPDGIALNETESKNFVKWLYQSKINI